MADTESGSAEGKLYTLSEISQRTGISMPTLQRYKKLYQNRLPSVGAGRKQRYPESALPVFDEIKNENAGKRGRPRKDGSAPRPSATPVAAKRGRKPAAAAKTAGKRAAGGRKTASRRAAPAPAQPARRGRKPAAAAAAATKGRGGRKASGSGNLMTLTQISEQTGISYPTLVRYVRLYSDRLPHEGKGRARRFHPEAVSAFRELRSESSRGGGGRKPAAAKATAGRGRGRGRAAAASTPTQGEGLSGLLQKRLKALEKSQEGLEKRFKGFVQSLQKLFR